MVKSHALPGFISDTRVHTEPTPRLKVSYADTDGIAQSQSFDFNTDAGRKFHIRFVSWALRNNITYTAFADI